ncbi:hypothetical protein ACFW03_13630 [Peribacillus butanolivorans]|uniref:hypothetical protein n=1 Tax=Peribacillus butanolivorans TaxID=421767 RepID=UPI0036887E05
MTITVKTPFINNRLSNKMQSEMHNHYELWEHPIEEVLFLENEDVVMQIDINEDSEFINVNTFDIVLRGVDIKISCISKAEKQKLGKS